MRKSRTTPKRPRVGGAPGEEEDANIIGEESMGLTFPRFCNALLEVANVIYPPEFLKKAEANSQRVKRMFQGEKDGNITSLFY